MNSITQYWWWGQPIKTDEGGASDGGPLTGTKQPESVRTDSGQFHTNPQDQNNQVSRVISARFRDFVPLPSNPDVPLTPAQLAALFPVGNREAAIREILWLGMKCEERSS